MLDGRLLGSMRRETATYSHTNADQHSESVTNRHTNHHEHSDTHTYYNAAADAHIHDNTGADAHAHSHKDADAHAHSYTSPALRPLRVSVICSSSSIPSVERGPRSRCFGEQRPAQLHAEASLEGCFSSHWGINGLKPHMRYSLAGGYQSNGENGLGSDYCITGSNRYRPIACPSRDSRGYGAVVDSPGHRRNILGKWHKKVNIGLAWDQYNFKAIH